MMFPTYFKTEASVLEFASFLCRGQSWTLTGTKAEYQDLPMVVLDQTGKLPLADSEYSRSPENAHV